jgi:hypothetical protein
MADVYSATVLQDARAWLKSESNKKFELRPVKTSILPAFLRDRQFTIPNLADIKKATTQTTTAMYFTKKDFTINTSKSNTPSGEKSGTASTDLTWAVKGFTIDLPSKQYDGNEVARQQGFAMSLYNAERTFWAAFDETLLAYLIANKSTVTNASGGGSSSSGVFTINYAERDEFYNILDAHMAMNDFGGEILDVHDTYWKKFVRHYSAQGGANSTNLSYQFDGFTTYSSNKIIPASSELSNHYVIPLNGVAIIDWNESANQRGDKLNDGSYLGTYQSLFYPELTFDLFVKSAWGSTGADGGSVQDKTETFEFSLNYALTTQPFTESGRSAIYQYKIANS